MLRWCPTSPPVAALGSACINYAAYENSPEAKAVAWVVFIIAETLLILVIVRTMYHSAQVARGRALWRDPLAPASAWVDEKTGGRRRPLRRGRLSNYSSIVAVMTPA